jgi:endonuclease/exonuclease/phosphatase family metal-dependent hydrolase
MPSTLRQFTKRLLVLLTIVCTALFLLACAAWYIPPGKFWWLALLGVGFAFLFFGTLGLFFFWIIFRSRWFLLPLFALLAGWKPMHAFFAFHPSAKSGIEKPAGAIRIMQWNVARFDEMSHMPGSGKSKRRQILEYIRKQNPDIICMQEFLESNNLALLNANIPFFKDSLGFTYFSYAMDHRRPDKRYEHGIAIFSKYPINNTGRWKFHGPKALKGDESYIYADITINQQKIRVFTTHLQSLLFTRTEFKNVEDIKKGSDSTIEKSWAIFRKFRQAYGLRQQQADLVRDQLDKSPYPMVICGDFNDVPNSYAYHRIKGSRQDAFTEKGFGIGRTFSSISPTLRIDYIMADKKFRVLQCRNPKPNLSDHFPVIADLLLENPE